MKKVTVGVVGTGQISNKYLDNMAKRFSSVLFVKAVCDLVPALAQQKAKEYGIPNVYTLDEMLADPEIEMIVNLTAPSAHAAINLKALHSGKHIYTEKPFALNRKDAEDVLSYAEQKGLLVGCAPDTFLGAGLQTCRKLIDDGWIGTSYAANGIIMMGNASNGMHPNFENFLKLGGDPLLDMGPYYITALVALLGPITRVTGSAQQLHSSITVDNPDSPRFNETVSIDAPTNVSAVFDFENGLVGSFQAAKESFGYYPRLEIFGTEGILHVPDPNFFGGEVRVTLPNGQMKEVPHTHPYAEEGRGMGVLDMAYTLREGGAPRASGRLAQHVLDVSLAIFESSSTGTHAQIKTTVQRPEALPLGLKYNRLHTT
ncbi:Gfo/Idh/MocA family protein [Aureibacillus halotolerans]|uniref:Putative dehydrogenase n=1 Tax=Aureibacillus halotolerans TaxID=1508390 RepID=A0A4R6U4E8_9BACI|nr:Gfo/Idh/MocA family oxidoreductase [Aureibacillus halotolerans]TDQ41011.1 putative dehydrogenase [Aureibacillus halotolerans]